MHCDASNGTCCHVWHSVVQAGHSFVLSGMSTCIIVLYWRERVHCQFCRTDTRTIQCRNSQPFATITIGTMDTLPCALLSR